MDACHHISYACRSNTRLSDIAQRVHEQSRNEKKMQAELAAQLEVRALPLSPHFPTAVQAQRLAGEEKAKLEDEKARIESDRQRAEAELEALRSALLAKELEVSQIKSVVCHMMKHVWQRHSHTYAHTDGAREAAG